MNRRLRRKPPKQTFAQRSGRSIRPMSLPPVLKIITPSLPALPPHPQHKLPSTSTRNGQWVGEITTAPARALSFSNPAILRPRKLQVLTTYTRELAEHSNIEAVVRQTLSEATGLALDLQMWSSDPGDATKPPGLFAGVTPITPTAGGGTNAMTGDLGNLFAALAAHSGGKTAVIIAALPQAVKLKLTAG